MVQGYVTFGLLCTIPVLTLFGNALVIACYTKFQFLRTKCHIFVISLATADICVSVFVMPLRLYEVINNGEWYLGHVLCDVVNIADVALSTTSILNLAGLAFERYLVICRNFFHRKLSRRKIILLVMLCWFLPVLVFVLPMAFKWHVIGIEHLINCASTSPSRCPLLLNVPYGIIATCTSFHVPLIFMIVCYWRILLAARRHTEVVRNFSTQRNQLQLQRETKAARTLGIVMGCFCICWLPFSVISTIGSLSSYSVNVPSVVSISMWLGYANSCMNPLLYYVFSHDFKVAYTAIFHCRCR
ncbi:5-hydroxytryptamine receptor 4-like [Gigantopelta aegis]|uniref:5-hydroxytryptamine receptor 4-like n=1 Tax=Gigantopelta aegis TaxID=1735272 RepID=UPI001B88AB57|nr:5-hydroxytryptamine receptor 4-like [Gigantopelta aegis]